MSSTGNLNWMACEFSENVGTDLCSKMALRAREFEGQLARSPTRWQARSVTSFRMCSGVAVLQVLLAMPPRKWPLLWKVLS